MPASRTPTPNRRRSCTGAASTNYRLVRPTGPYGPCCGVRKESHGLRGYAYADGSRASWHDGGYSAEKSACSRWLLQDTQGCAYPNTRKTGRRFIQMPAASSTRTLVVFQHPSRRAGVQKNRHKGLHNGRGTRPRQSNRTPLPAAAAARRRDIQSSSTAVGDFVNSCGQPACRIPTCEYSPNLSTSCFPAIFWPNHPLPLPGGCYPLTVNNSVDERPGSGLPDPFSFVPAAAV